MYFWLTQVLMKVGWKVSAHISTRCSVVRDSLSSAANSYGTATNQHTTARLLDQRTG